MNYTLCLVAASCLAGTADGTGCGCAQATVAAACDCQSACEACSKPGLLDRIRARLCQKKCDTCCCQPACGCQTVAPPVVVVPQVTVPVVHVTQQEPRDPSRIRSEYLPRVGHSPDYSSVTGELYYVHADGGMWVVRYAPIDTEDRYGGSVVVAAVADMSDFREGDLVTVRGEVLNEGRASKHLGGPLYRVVSAQLVERGER
jgi:hypothetical protein